MNDDTGDGLEPGDIVAERYRITAHLGVGGFASTYAAHDLETNQLVAVKALSLAHVNDWKTVELFRREANALRTLSHAQIPAYIDFVDVEADRSGFLVQALAQGSSIAALLAGGRRFSQEECLDVARQMLGVLEYLASLRPPMVHRDIKPANIILDDGGRVRLVDFGAVRELAGSTISGSTMVGTLGYMAPEQLAGQATCVSDLYALGMTLVHMLTGKEPSELPRKRLKPHFRDAVDIDPAFQFLLDRMLEAVPEDRVSSATAALTLLRDTTIVRVVPPGDGGTPVDELVRVQQEALASKARKEKLAVMSKRDKIARRRAQRDGWTTIRHGEAELTLSYAPPLGQRLTGWAWAGFACGTGFLLAACTVIPLSIVQQWSLPVIINVAVWLGLFGCAGGIWAAALVHEALKRRLSIRVTQHGNFMVFRKERRPLAVGRLTDLKLDVWPGDADQEFGQVRVRSGTYMETFDRLTDRDIAVFEQFREVANLSK